jgi:hypothetical protein
LFEVSDWLVDVRNNTPVDALLNVVWPWRI